MIVAANRRSTAYDRGRDSSYDRDRRPAATRTIAIAPPAATHTIAIARPAATHTIAIAPPAATRTIAIAPPAATCDRERSTSRDPYDRDRSTSRGSSQPPPPRDVRMEVGVAELTLSQDAMRTTPRPRNVSVRLELPPGVDDGIPARSLETRALPTGSSSAPQLRFDSSHELIFERGSRAWQALQRALEGPKAGSDLYILAVDAGTGSTLGEASLRLQDLLGTGRAAPPASTSLELRDAQTHTKRLGSVRVRTDGMVEALQEVLNEGGGRDDGRYGGRDGGSRPGSAASSSSSARPLQRAATATE